MTIATNDAGRRRVPPVTEPGAMAPPDPAWVGGFSIAVGEYRVGLHADNTDVLESIRDVFGPWMIESDEITDDFGISVDRRGGGGPRLIPQLLHGRANVLRTRSLPRLLRCLDAILAGLVDDGDAAGHKVSGLAAIIRGDAAALVPTDLAERSTAVERALIADGATIAERVAIRLDLARQAIVVVPGLPRDRPCPQIVDGTATAPGVYTLRSIFWTRQQLDPEERRATGVARMAELVDLPDGARRRQELLEQIVSLSDRFQPTAIERWGADVSAVVETLV